MTLTCPAKSVLMRARDSSSFKTPELGVLPGPRNLSGAWNMYLRKIYLKTASLIAKAARASVSLGGCAEGDVLREVAYSYGRNLGMAYQVSDDTEAPNRALRCIFRLHGLKGGEEGSDENGVFGGTRVQFSLRRCRRAGI